MKIPWQDRQIVEEKLLEVIRAERKRFLDGECGDESYRQALAEFAAFIFEENAPNK